MQLHNCYTVRNKNGAQTAFNALAEDFWQKATAHPQWAKYFALQDEDGACVFAPAVLSFVNSDPSRGGTLRAQYAAVAECAQKRYVRVSLCCERNALDAMSTAQIDLQGDGGETEITALIVLEAEAGTDVCFGAGDNPLVRRLLGCGKEQENIEIGWGSCAYPARVCRRNDDLIEGKSATTADVYDGGMRIRSTENTQGCELLLYFDGVPALRALRPFTRVAVTDYATIPNNNALLISNRPESVFNVRVGDEALLRLDVCPVVTAATRVHDDYVRDMGAAGDVLTDPGGEYVAFVTASYVELYKVDVLDLTLCMRVARTNETVFVCRGGAVGLWGASSLVIHVPNGDGDSESYRYPFPRGTACMLIREGELFHAAYCSGSVLYRYALTLGGTVSLIEKASSPSPTCVLGRCGDAMARMDVSLYIDTITTRITNEFSLSQFSMHGSSRTVCGVGDGFFVTREGGACFLYDLIHDTVIPFDLGLKASGRLLIDGKVAYAYNYYSGFVMLKGSYDVEGCTGACLAGDGMFVVKDGKLYVYYLSGTDWAVRMPADKVGQTASYTVRERRLVGLDAPAAFTISP